MTNYKTKQKKKDCIIFSLEPRHIVIFLYTYFIKVYALMKKVVFKFKKKFKKKRLNKYYKCITSNQLNLFLKSFKFCNNFSVTPGRFMYI